MSSFRVALMACLLVSMALCQGPATITLHGIDGNAAFLSSAELAKLPHHRFTVAERGTPADFEGVLLRDAVAKVAMPTEEKSASCYLLVEGADGHRAVFAWAEDRKAYLVARRGERFDVVVPGDNRTARWVRQVKALSVIEATGPPSWAALPEHTRWIAASLKEMQSIKVGMTRAELLKVFTTEGGISTRAWRRYAYRGCPFIKVDVEFAPADNRGAFVENPADRITKISPPFLEWTIAD